MKINTTHKTLAAAAIAAFATMLGLASAQADDDFVAAAKAEVAKLSAQQTTWEGPTTGAKPDPGKLIVYIADDEQNDAAVKYGTGITEAAQLIGWKVAIIDGRGTTSGQQEAFNQAIALKPDAIASDTDAQALKQVIKEANDRGIIVIGVHSAGTAGPHPELGLFTNIQTEGTAVGNAQGEWIVAHSDGKARVVITTDCLYTIACQKAHGVEDVIKKCTTCTELEFNNSPAGEAQTRMPPLTTAWVQKYGTPIYITSVNDSFADFQAVALRAGGVDPSQAILVSADGTSAGYQRIRAGNQYQTITVPEPINMQSYQVVDEIIRAMHKMPPSNFQQSPYLVTPDNVSAEGGDKNGYDPSNDYRKHYAEIWGVAAN